jgi:hypothetical protein
MYSGDTTQNHDLCISHIGCDRTHITASDSGAACRCQARQHAIVG